MAKRRPLKSGAGQPAVGQRVDIGGSSRLGEPSFSPASLMGLATAMIAAALVYAGYWPSDSIEVQTGGARYLAGLLMAAATLAMLVRASLAAGDWLIDALAWGLALWMIVATWANAENANLRLAVNELWWWIAAAALLSATRRCAGSPAIAIALLHVIAAVTVGVAVFGWHQLLIGFPATIAAYEANAEAMLREAGIFAEKGSAQRVLFENRLYDGGPTGTFALANSMAALLVGGSIVMIAVAGLQWRHLTVWRRLAWAIATGVTLGMLVASRSRSAVGSILAVAMIFVCLKLLARVRRSGGTWRPRRGVLIGGSTAMLVVLGLGVAMSWPAVSQSEWVGQAPASLAFRINYWQASAKMLGESPLVGVGPGQFKARYEAFRAPESTEQIADPHNWIWQVLTTGGMPAGLLLCGLAAAILWRAARSPAREQQRETMEQQRENAKQNDEQQHAEPLVFPSQWVYAGAGAAAMAVWIAGAAIGYLPMLGAALAATMAGVLVIVMAAWRRGSAQGASVSMPAISQLALWALAAMAIDLLAAGGLSVPGVAVTLWVLAGIAAPCVTRLPATGAAASVDRRRTAAIRWVIGGIATVLLISWYVTAILPVEQAAGPLGRFQMAWSQRRYGEAESALRQATAADRWDPQPPLQLAQVLMQQALYSPQDRQSWETRWQQVEAEALHRAGRDPVSLHVLADARLWHYQRYGDAAVLQAAAELYRRAVELSPSHQSYAAQLAEIYRQLADPRAGELARRAHRLSQLGGYYERSLPFVILLPAETFGEAALAAPIRRPASEVLAPLLEPPN